MVLAWQKGVAEVHLMQASRTGGTHEINSELWVKAQFCKSDGNIGIKAYATIY